MSSLITVCTSIISLVHVRTHKSPDLTLFKLPRQNGQDSDLVFLQYEEMKGFVNFLVSS